jgi:cold shock CspA family protein
VTKLFEDHGFVESENSLEIYFHKNNVLGEGFSKLKPGISVTFVEEQGGKRPTGGHHKTLGSASALYFADFLRAVRVSGRILIIEVDADQFTFGQSVGDFQSWVMYLAFQMRVRVAICFQ